MDYKILVYKAVRQIPRGKVSTYGNISNYISKHLKANSYQLKANITSRMVGWALQWIWGSVCGA